MTALTATPQPGTGTRPPCMLLQVTGAPNPPAGAYASNFSAGTSADGWTAAGAGVQALWTSPDPFLYLHGADSGTVGNVITASRVVSGLTVGAQYKFKVTVTRNTPNGGNTRLRITGGVTGAYLAVPVGANSVLELVFTATATSHTVNVDQQRTYAGTAEGIFLLDPTTVAAAGTWQGTTIRRTDANGTDVVVREDAGGNDVAGGVMTLTDYEAALVGPVGYTVTDGLGGVAYAIASFGTIARINAARNPDFEAGLDGWTSTNPGTATMTSTAVAPIAGTRSGLLTCMVAGTIAAQFVPALTDRAKVTPGQLTQMAVTVRPSAALSMSVDLSYYDAAGAAVGAYSGGPPQVCPAGQDTRLSRQVTPPAGAVYVRVLAVATGAAVGNTIRVDSLYVGAPGDYFDGDTPATDTEAFGWAGPEHASPSVAVAAGQTDAGAWLTLPATAVPSTTPPQFVGLSMVTDYQETSDSNGTVHTIVNRADKVANPGPLALRTGQVVLWCPTWDAARAVRKLLDSGEVAMLRQPTFRGMDLYLYATSVHIGPEDKDTDPRRWAAAITYEEVLAP